MKKNSCRIVCLLSLALLATTLVAAAKKTYYCKYCGRGYQTINALTATDCYRHPAGKHKHELYQGAEKEMYECQYCGSRAESIQALTAPKCRRHPSGAFKGHHVPAL